ncbi:MAG: dihydropteroate synthase [Gammaproteobacteria bacterium]|nr:dihydropteroate synthase [Gammaproteobacteria bacterium]MCP5425024.1 dihydropteroate synthase [Gammaproteobacteria bacterium]
MPGLNCAGRYLDLDRPSIMGVLNVTPDSFSDGGRYPNLRKASQHAARMVVEGADLIDIGGESTRPGAPFVSVQEELDRVLPILEFTVRELPVLVSVDTSKPAVMREALRAGAAMINDVRALQNDGALEIVASTEAAVCLMHMQGMPATMQTAPQYDDLLTDIYRFLETRMQACLAAGITHDRIVLDPGFGFGKTLAHNLLLLKKLGVFHTLGAPLLVGLSRKSMIGQLLDAPVEERLFGSLSAAVIAAWQGARIIRVHDVKETAQALRICSAVLEAVES